MTETKVIILSKVVLALLIISLLLSSSTFFASAQPQGCGPGTDNPQCNTVSPGLGCNSGPIVCSHYHQQGPSSATPTPTPTATPTPIPVPPVAASNLCGNYLSGDYKSNSDARYYMRQIGDSVVWVGIGKPLSSGSPSFENVFNGFIQGTTLVGDWVDTPHGATHSNGTITLQIIGSNPFHTSLRAISQTGGFGDSVWEKIYPDFIDNKSC